MNVLALNAGSNSLKFDIVLNELDRGEAGAEFGKKLVSGSYDDIGKQDASFSLYEAKEKRQHERREIRDYPDAVKQLLDWIDSGNAREQGIADLRDLHRVGHRVVHGADRFDGPARITAEALSQIEALEDLAPLHNQSALSVIRAAQARLGQDAPMFAVFDTVFHRSIPDEAALYALPVDVAQRNKIRRYGFHGISHRYLTLRYAQIMRRPLEQLNLVTLHLEGGASAAAIRGGKSLDTSMGFTPLEGLVMGTRCGDLDPAVVTYLMRKENLNAASIEKFLNTKCGLIGLSGQSADTRVLVRHMDDPRVRLALAIFSYRVRKYIGAYFAALGGAEAVVLGGGISENTPQVREQILQGLDWFGLTLDPARNREIIDREGPITTDDSRVQAWIIPSEEGLMVAHEVSRC